MKPQPTEQDILMQEMQIKLSYHVDAVERAERKARWLVIILLTLVAAILIIAW